MNLAKITLPKSLVASVGVHALILALSTAAFYSSSKESLELTGLNDGARGNGKPVTIASFNLVTKAPKMAKITAPKSRAVVKADPKDKVVSLKKDNKTVEVQDAVTEQVAAVSADGPVGDGTGTGVGTGSGLGIGNGASDFDGGALFTQVNNYFQNRLGSNLKIRENQLIKVKLKLNRSGEVLTAELIEGSLEMINLRKILAVARNVPVKLYWKSSRAFPGELTIPLFLATND